MRATSVLRFPQELQFTEIVKNMVDGIRVSFPVAVIFVGNL